MDVAWINIGLAFVEGFGLIISPCILPILPIILSGSLTGSKARPIGIITGFAITFTIVTLFSKIIVDSLHIDPNTLRDASFIVLLLLGIMMVSTYFTEKFNLLTQRLTRVGSSIERINNPQSGFWGGLLFGGLVGIIWTPCAGPILAAIIVQVVIQKTTLGSLFTVIAFAIGAGLPMLLIALIGRQILDRLDFIRHHTTLFRKVLGIIIIVSVIFLMFNSGAMISFSSKSDTAPTHVSPSALSLINGLAQPYKAPDIAGIDAWINSPPLTLSALKGKVVLIDFWTYSCINCIRTLPYLKDWYAKYHDKGFTIIGVHSPEFQFEHDLDNVKNAVLKDGILYPVALDNRFVTWQNFGNQYWPAHYLINKDGEVVYVHFGEGEYDVTENNIRYLLGLHEPVISTAEKTSPSIAQTPETYLGYARAVNFSSPEIPVKDKVSAYSYPSVLLENGWALQGEWTIYPEKIVAESSGASIKIHFNAGKVYAVMGVEGRQKAIVELFLNGEPLIDQKGNDVTDSQVEVTNNQLYFLVNLKQAGEGTLELTTTVPGLEIYTFTFGN